MYENIVQLKLKSNKDGKKYKTDTLDTKGILRLIESVSSPNAEPFKMWLANLGKERIDEVFDPELAIKRAIDYYRNHGYSDRWIESRLKGILDRNKLTDRIDLEQKLGETIISNTNSLNYQYLEETKKLKTKEKRSNK